MLSKNKQKGYLRFSTADCLLTLAIIGVLGWAFIEILRWAFSSVSVTIV